MARMRLALRGMSLAISFGGAAGAAQAQTAEQLLARTPAIAGVVVSMPTAAEISTCRVEKREWPASAKGVKPSGVIVRDGNARVLRQFIDLTGEGKGSFTIVSYFTDGVESFREMDTNANGKPDTFRWLGANGSKQGVDADEDGTIDQWVAISPEEVTLEVFQAVQQNNRSRLKALLLSEAELKMIGVPEAEGARIRAKLARAEAKLTDVSKQLKLSATAKWMHAELTPPQTTPSGTQGSTEDVVKYRGVPVLIDPADGKTMSYINTGEMIQVGRAWRLIDAPIAGTQSDDAAEPGVASVPTEIRKFVDELTTIPAPKNNAETSTYHLARASLLHKCVAGTSAAEQLPWLKQLIDAYAAAVETADKDGRNTLDTLLEWQKSINEGGTPETKAYIAFRRIGAESSVVRKEAGTDGPKLAKAEAARKDAYEAFAKAHPASPDAAEAVLQLAMMAEFTDNGESAAKGWYEKLTKDYPTHIHAARAAGALKRLGSAGKPFELTGETMEGKAFSSAALAGKPTLVFYWASWGNTAADDLKLLADIEKEKKGIRIVTVCLDDEQTKPAAAAMLRTAAVPGEHLYAAGGLDRSPLALTYGIHMVPHVFLLDSEGKVASKNAQFSKELKAEFEKLLK